VATNITINSGGEGEKGRRKRGRWEELADTCRDCLCNQRRDHPGSSIVPIALPIHVHVHIDILYVYVHAKQKKKVWLKLTRMRNQIRNEKYLEKWHIDQCIEIMQWNNRRSAKTEEQEWQFELTAELRLKQQYNFNLNPRNLAQQQRNLTDPVRENHYPSAAVKEHW
jgi:hypothetical protein